jgi:hypothetical protein
MDIMIYKHRRRSIAGPDTVSQLKRKFSVGSGFARTYPDLILDALNDHLGAFEVARDASAHPDNVLAGGSG